KAFSISFTSQSAPLSAKVSNRLASLFIEENLKVREQQVLGTADFFDRQLEKAKQDLDERSQKLAQLKAKYAAELPESLNLHLQALTSAQLALRAESESASRAQNQEASVQLLLAQSPNVVNLDSADGSSNNGLHDELGRLQEQMSQLRSRYGQSYPDV